MEVSMEQKSFLSENTVPVGLAILVMIAGTASLATQGYFVQETAVSPTVFSNMRLMMLYDGGRPMLLASVPSRGLLGLSTLMGSAQPETDSMVLGYEEAKEMTKRKNITTSDVLWGYTLNGFLGRDVRIGGMLKKTGTPLDMMHLLAEGGLERFSPGQPVEVRLTEEKMPKFFYLIRPDGTNWPAGIRFSQGGMLGFQRIDEERVLIDLRARGWDLRLTQKKTYQPLVLGSTEAEMMLTEGMFRRVGDRIDGFFGKDVVVAGILQPTGTALDMMHYMPGG